MQNRALDWVVGHHPALGLEARAEYFIRFFEKFLAPESLVLDIGGGWGFYGEPLARRGHHVTVLEVRKLAVQKRPAVIYEPGGPFPFPDKSFDASMLVTVLHHIADPEPVIRETRRVTRRYLMVVEDLYHHALGRMWTHVRDQLYNFEFFGHPSGFRKREAWIELFEKHGFTLREEHQVYTWLAGMRILNGIFIFEVSP